MKNKLVLGIFSFLMLMASSVFASMVENSRQGSPAISAEMQPASTLGNPEQHQGLSLVLLELLSDSLFLSKDPIGFKGDRNLWVYAKNNPGNVRDPFGLLGISITPSPWRSELFRWVKPYSFTLDGYQPPPQADLNCPEYVVIQWIKGFVNYANVPDGWSSKFQKVQMYGVMTDHNFPAFQVDSAGDTDPIFNSQGTLVKFPGGNNPWTDNIKVQKTRDEAAYPLSGELEFVTAVYPFADIKNSLNLSTLNAQASNFMYNQPPVAANRIWSLKFSVSSSDAMPQEDFFGIWP